MSLALAAGMFSVVPAAHAMPTPDAAANAANPHSSGVIFNPNAAADSGYDAKMDVTGPLKNNVVNWKDFSVASNEQVHFTNSNNYMNIVTGKATSAIKGKISGGGDVYLINPNGVIFGETANVNVGNLYVSTREATTDVINTFVSGNSHTKNDGEGNPVADPICTPFNTVIGKINENTAVAASDIVNLTDGAGHSVAAQSVVMEGRNIRFLNVVNTIATGTAIDPADTITGKVTLRSNKNADYADTGYTDGYIHIGHKDMSVSAVNTEVSNAYAKYAFGYTNNAAAREKTKSQGVVDYTLIYNEKTLGDGKLLLTDITGDKLSGNFMLAENIDASALVAPIGTGVANKKNGHGLVSGNSNPFSGMVDGMFYEISGLSLSGGEMAYEGLFGYTKDARIENLGVASATITANHAGGIVGYADNTALLNVWNESGTVGNGNGKAVTGGLVGVAVNKTKIQSAYNKSEVAGAGLVGYLAHSDITDAYNTGSVAIYNGEKYGIVNTVDLSSSTNLSNIKRVYTTQGSANSVENGSNVFQYNHGVEDTAAFYTSTVYTGFNISDEGGVQKEDGKLYRPTWRIYEGESLPLLTAFFQGVVSTDYNYDVATYNADSEQMETFATLNSLDQYAAKGIAGKTYDSTSISPATYVEAENGDYDYVAGAGYVEYDPALAAEYAPMVRYTKNNDGTYSQADDGAYVYVPGKYVKVTDGTGHYNKAASTVVYYGANNDSSKITAHTENYTQNNAGKYTLFSSGQQGYDLYGNNFQIDKRKVTFKAEGQSNDKVYDGKTYKEYGAAGGLIGVLPSDTTVTATGTVKYYYTTDGTKATATKDVGNDRIIFIEKSDDLKVVDSITGNESPNYDVDLVPPDEQITANVIARKVIVELAHETGIDKTYDGGTALRDKDAVALYTETKDPETGEVTSTSGNIKILESTDALTQKSDVSLDTLLGTGEGKADKVYLDFATDAAYADADGNPDGNASARLEDKTISYKGIILKDDDGTELTNDLGNYELIVRRKNGDAVEAETDGTYTLTGTGTIAKRKVEISLIDKVGNKVYDGTSAVGNTSVNYGTTTVNAALGTTGNLSVALKRGDDETDNTYINNLITNDFGGETPTVADDGFAANYVTSAGAATVNVVDSDHVEYSGVKLDTDADLSNYEIWGMNSDNQLVALALTDPEDATAGYTMYAGDGRITPRALSTDAITVTAPSGSTANFNKIYNGKSREELGEGYTFAFQTGTTAGELLACDDGKLTLSSSEIIYGKKTDTSFTETADAEDAGGANWVKYGVTVGLKNGATAEEAKVLTNYKWAGTTGTQINDGDEVMAGGQSATVAKRNITVELVHGTTDEDLINKVYDGDKNVKDKKGSNGQIEVVYKDGGIAYDADGATTGSGASGNLRYASYDADTVLVDDETEIKITSAIYSDKNVAYVIVDGEETEALDTKTITYTVAIRNTGDKDAAKNYIINDGVLMLTADGIISPAPLTIAATTTSNDKTYDGTSAANAASDTYLTVTGLKTDAGDTFDYDAVNAISPQYVVYNEDTEAYDAASDVDDYNTPPTKAVEYANILDALVDGEGHRVDKNYKINGKHYKASNTIYGKGIISKRTIAVGDLEKALTVTNKNIGLTMTYNGTQNYENEDAPLSGYNGKAYVGFKEYGPGTGQQNSILAQDMASIGITIAEAVYAKKNVGAFDGAQNNDVTLTFTLTGDALSNYTFAEGANSASIGGFTGNITTKPLGVKFVGDAPTKPYDATTVVKANGVTFDGDFSKENNPFKGWFALDGLVEGDNIYLTTSNPTQAKVTAVYDDKNVSDDNIAIHYTGFEIAAGGTDSVANYDFVNSIDGVGTITKRSVYVTSVSDGVDKVYDGDALVKSLPTNPAFAITLSDGTDNNDIFALDALEPNGKNRSSITTLEGVGTTSQYGDITRNATTGAFEKFEENANVNRASRTDTTIGNRDIRYTGVEDFLGGNYELVEHTATDAEKYWVKKDASTNKTYVYGLGKINPTVIDLNDIQVGTIEKTYDGTVNVVQTAAELTDKLYITGEDTLGWLSQLSVTNASYVDSSVAGDAANYGEGNKHVSLTITLPDTAVNFDLPDGEASSVQKVATNGTIHKRTINAVILDLDHMSAEDKALLTKVYNGNEYLSTAIENAKKFVLLTNVAAADDNNSEKLAVAVTNIKYADKNATLTDTAKNTKVQYELGTLTGTSKDNYTLAEANSTLSGWGNIKQKEIAFAFIDPEGNPVKFTKEFDYNPATQAKFTDANNTALVAAVQKWWENNAVAGDEFGDSIGQLSGVYGVWQPATNPTGFTEWGHVYYTDANQQKHETSDISFNLALIDDALNNYKITNGTTIDGTVYFQEAMKGRGKILPISITMGALKEQWTAPDIKVYDGSGSIGKNGNYVGYRDSDKAELGDVTNYLTIYYDADNINGLSAGDVVLPYTVNSAVYYKTVAGEKVEDKDAGATGVKDKPFMYNGFKFAVVEDGDYQLEAGKTVTDLKNKYDGIVSGDVKGGIAKRVVNVVADGENRSREYNGGTEITIPDGEHYTGVDYKTSENQYMGLIGTDGAYVAYTANFDDPNVNMTGADPEQGVYGTRNVVYTLSLEGDNGQAANNYTLSGVTAERKVTQTGVSQITPKEVYVDFAPGVDGSSFAKIYDKLSSVVDSDDGKCYTYTDPNTGITTRKALSDILSLTGVYDGEATIDFTTDGKKPIANYVKVDANGNPVVGDDGKVVVDENVAFNGNGITTKKVYIQNLNLTGTGADNYVLKVKNENGNAKASMTTANTTEQTLEGSGTIAQRKLEVVAKGSGATKVYDGTKDVLQPDSPSAKYVSSADGIALTDADPYLEIESGLAPAIGSVAADGYTDVDVTVETALYHNKDVNGLGVTYKLKVNNQNYELVRYALDEGGNKTSDIAAHGKEITIEGAGSITPRTLTYNTGDALSVNKTYDGTSDVKGASVTTGIFAYASVDANGKLMTDTGLIQGEDVQLEVKNGSYKDTQGNPVSDTGAAAGNINGANRTVDVRFIIWNPNYTLDAGNNTGAIKATDATTGEVIGTGKSKTGSYTGTGRIDRALVKMTPNDATYYVGDAIPSSGYTGTVSGLQNNETLPNGYSFVSDGNVASSVGNYMLLGYVDGKTVAAGANEFTFVDGIGNYYFTTTPNTALHVNARASDVDNGLIADKKFTPDDYSYNRISKDQDLTRLNRESSAAVQYAEKGVNLDGGDTKSGLSALADIQGAGSVVNLEGAFIRTSAPAEQPETVAAEAALPVPETEESDISSISLEYAGDGDNSQALLEILTNASSNAEKKGTSIVIDAQDEDEEDAEEEKSRRAIFADRSNIGIETLGDAVNLNQMIG